MIHANGGSVPAGYFQNKKGQSRKKVNSTSRKAAEAVEIATKVLRLCYPLRNVAAVNIYYNNAPIEPFLLPEHPELTTSSVSAHREMSVPIREYVVVDVYFLFDDAFASKGEDDSFVVEVTFPVGAQRTRWDSIVRVRWTDLGWQKRDMPTPELTGETFVSNWM